MKYRGFIGALLPILVLAWLQSSARAEQYMVASVGGAAGLLRSVEVVEVWSKGENGSAVVAICNHRPEYGDKRFLLTGFDTTFIADGFRLSSNMLWNIIVKKTYKTVAGVERSILVAEPTHRQPAAEPYASCANADLSTATWQTKSCRIVQILGEREMLVTMRVGTRFPGMPREPVMVLLRGISTANLTEDSPLKFATYPITGTYQYQSITGSFCTVFVADASDEAMEKYRAREEKLQAESAAGQKTMDAEKARGEKELSERMQAADAARREAALWRTWTLKTGRELYEARFDGVCRGYVKLTKRDGKKKRVPLYTLSDGDREWIESFSKNEGEYTPRPHGYGELDPLF